MVERIRPSEANGGSLVAGTGSFTFCGDPAKVIINVTDGGDCAGERGIANRKERPRITTDVRSRDERNQNRSSGPDASAPLRAGYTVAAILALTWVRCLR